MSRRQHLIAIFLLPFHVTILFPIILLVLSVWTGMPWLFVYPLNIGAFILGSSLIVLGLTVQYKTNRAFARVGKGTLAPWAPTQHFVMVGLYRHVRNPMILGVLLTLLGEAVFLGSTLIFIWFVVFGLMNHIWFIKKEEPDLEQRFGTDYRVYKQHVGRWIPRWSAWTPEDKNESSNHSADRHA
jgi:protein-S-isoprenylcysteine O-methyltransferase Ste14